MYIKHITGFSFLLFGLLLCSCTNDPPNGGAPDVEQNPTLPAITALPISARPPGSLASPTSATGAEESRSRAETAILTGSIPISMPLSLAMDQTFAYWVDKGDLSTIKRVQLAEPQRIEIIASSTYTSGSVSDPVVSLNNRWLFYLDSPTWYISSEWKFIVLDLTTHTTKTVLEPSGAPYETQSISSPELVWFSLNADELLLAYGLLPGADGCQRFVTRLVNLNDLHSRVLQETNCTVSAEVWLWPQIDQHYLVTERDQPVGTGGGTNILLYALNTGAMTMLTQDGVNAQPYLSNDYVVWKRANRSDFGLSAGVYNRHTQQTKTVTFPAKFSRMMVSEHWLYWIPDTLQSLYVYDLDRDHFIQVADSQNCMFSFDRVAMRGSVLAWFRAARDTNNFFLEWRSVVDLPSGLFTLCDPPKV